MGMFTNYKNIPNCYIPNNQCQKKVDLTAVKLPYELYDPQGNFIGYYWNYGDSVDLQFTTYGNVVYTQEDGSYAADETAETFLTTQVGDSIKQLHLQIKDFRQEVVFERIVNADITVRFPITYSDSCRLVRGKYTYTLDVEIVHFVRKDENGEYVVVPIKEITEDDIRVVEKTYNIPSDSSIIMIR